MQIADRAAEDVLGSGAGIADFLQQNPGKIRRPGLRHGALRHPSVPKRLIQVAQNAFRLRRNVADRIGEQIGRMGDGAEHVGLDVGTRLRVVLVERVMHRHHHMAIPLGPAISLVGLCGTAGGDVFHRAEFDDFVVGIEHRSQRDPDRNMDRVGAGDDDARGVQNRHDGPVVLADEIREDQVHFIFESEDQAQDAKRRSVVVHDAKGIDQRFLAIRDQIGFAETLHVTGFGLDRLPHDRIVADGDRCRVVEPRYDAAARIEQDDVGIDRILANVLAEPGPQGRQRVALIGRHRRDCAGRRGCPRRRREIRYRRSAQTGS